MSRLSPRSGLDAAHRAAGPHDTHCAGAQPCLVAESLCALTKKERQADACLSFLAGAEGLEPSARGFGVDVGEHGRERGKERCWPILPDKSQKSGAGLVLWGIFQAEIRCQIASLRGSSTTGQDLYSSQGSKSMQAAGSRFPSKSQAKVLLRTVRHSLNTCPTRGTQCRLCGTTQFLV